MEDLDLYGSMEDLASALGVSTKTVQRAIRDGRITAVNIFGRVRISPAEFERVVLGEGILACPTCRMSVGSARYRALALRGLCDEPTHVWPPVEPVEEPAPAGTIDAPTRSTTPRTKPTKATKAKGRK